MRTSTGPSAELHAFVATVREVGPRALSACPGWTAHDVAAHLTGAAAEIVRHLEPFLAGEPVPATRSFEVREPPFRALGFDDLLDRLVVEVEAVHRVVARVPVGDRAATVPWTGRRMVVSTFPTHLRSELALHRWDLVGADTTGAELLAAPDLTAHALDVLGAILPRAGAARDSGEAFLAVLRSPGAADVVVEVGDGAAVLRRPRARESAGPGLTLDAADRLLLLWGRRPDRPAGGVSDLPGADLRRLQDLLAGY